MITVEEYEREIGKYVAKIRTLSAELQRERQVVDFYASEHVYRGQDFAFGVIGSTIEIDKGQYARNHKNFVRKLDV